MQTADFDVPHGMKPDVMAKTFAAYLQGSLAFENRTDDRGELRSGPYKQDKTSEDSWQLDTSNDFWLHINGDKARIHHRYPRQKAVAEAAVALFVARFFDERQANTAA